MRLALTRTPRGLLRGAAFFGALVSGAALLGGALTNQVASVFVLVAICVTSYTGVGLLLALKLPLHPAGWILLCAGALAGFVQFAEGIAQRMQLAISPTALQLATYTAALVVATLIAFVVPMYLPEGRLPRPVSRWRPISILTFVCWVYLVYGYGTGRFKTPSVNDSQGVVGVLIDLNELFVLLAALASLAVVFVVPVVAGVTRYRQASGLERQQLKWIALPIVLMFAGYAATTFVTPKLFGPNSLNSTYMFWLATSLIPLGIAMAVLRYRLYSIDTLISKTITYSAATAILAIVFGLLNAALGRASESIFGADSSAGVAISAAAVAIAFGPLRRRVEEVVDARLKPAPSAIESLGRLQEQLALIMDARAVETLCRRVLQDSVRALEATGGRIDVRVGDARIAVCAVGEPYDQGAAVTLQFGAYDPSWGTLAIGPRRNGSPYTRAEVALVRELATLAAGAFETSTRT